MVTGPADRERIGPLGHPVADAVAVGHDPRAGFELARELRPQPGIHLRREEERDHCGGLDIGSEDVLDAECHAVGDTGPDGVGLGFADALGVEVHAYPACAELLGDCLGAVGEKGAVDQLPRAVKGT